MPSRARSPTRTPLIAEAGTGTGKTFAYLVPALLYGGKVIVSTGTKTLQDQLFQRDLPLVRDALGAAGDARAAQGPRQLRLPPSSRARPPPRDACPRARTRGTCRRSSRSRARRETGDRGELADVPENATIWPLVTSTRDNCLGGDCAFHADCFVLKARKAALEADVVVVNHHLFFADVMLRDEGLAELLPACNTVILDEAHQLPDTATLFFGEQLTRGQLAELARDAEVAARTGAREVADASRCRGRRRPRDPEAAPRARRDAGQARAARRRRARRIRRRRSTSSPPRSTASPPSSRSSPSAARTSPTARGARRTRRRRSRAGAPDSTPATDAADARRRSRGSAGST